MSGHARTGAAHHPFEFEQNGFRYTQRLHSFDQAAHCQLLARCSRVGVVAREAIPRQHIGVDSDRLRAPGLPALSSGATGFTGAAAEGFNSIIQTIKANARGFSSFANFRTRILFFCGKLDLTLASV